jgi:predicted nucleotide-binding protein
LHCSYSKTEASPTVFIGHGGSSHWRDLKDHLQDKHHIKVEAYETGARAGHTIRDILDEMVNKSTFALLIMTGEDEQGSGQKRARQNVIHEIGLFQGKLGFNRAIVLMEHTTEEFSNIAGIQQIRYTNISETFGEVLATIKREFD